MKLPLPAIIQPERLEETTLTLELGGTPNPVSFTLKCPESKFSARLNALQMILRGLIEEILPPAEVPFGGKVVKFVAGAYALTPQDEILVVDASGGAVPISLPTATCAKEYLIIKEDDSANAVTVTPFGNDLFELSGSSKVLSSQAQKLHIRSDSVSTWYDLGTGNV